LRERLPVFDMRSFWPPRPVDDERFEEEPASERRSPATRSPWRPISTTLDG
jgi:hypothetical protein